jgi:hypothetical protein
LIDREAEFRAFSRGTRRAPFVLHEDARPWHRRKNVRFCLCSDLLRPHD